MDKKIIEKIIAGVAVVGSLVGGTFMVSRDMQESEIKEMRNNLVEKAEQGTLTYSEYKQLITAYNAEIQEAKEKGEDFKLDNIDKNNTIIKKLNDKIVE